MCVAEPCEVKKKFLGLNEQETLVLISGILLLALLGIQGFQVVNENLSNKKKSTNVVSLGLRKFSWNGCYFLYLHVYCNALCVISTLCHKDSPRKLYQHYSTRFMSYSSTNKQRIKKSSDCALSHAAYFCLINNQCKRT